MAKTSFGSGYKLVITGDELVQKRLMELHAAMSVGFNAALREEGQKIYDLSQVYVPFDTGALQRSGKIADGREEGSYVVAIGYGDESVNQKSLAQTREYARYQHETNPTEGKYLERALDDISRGMVERMAQKLKGVQ